MLLSVAYDKETHQRSMQQKLDKHAKIQSQGFQDSQHPYVLEQYFDLKTESYFTKVNTINQFIHSKTIIFKGLFMRKAIITITIYVQREISKTEKCR